MSISESANKNDVGVKTMTSGNRKLEQAWSGIGWGLFLILVGGLFLVNNRGWLQEGNRVVIFCYRPGSDSGNRIFCSIFRDPGKSLERSRRFGCRTGTDIRGTCLSLWFQRMVAAGLTGHRYRLPGKRDFKP